MILPYYHIEIEVSLSGSVGIGTFCFQKDLQYYLFNGLDLQYIFQQAYGLSPVCIARRCIHHFSVLFHQIYPKCVV
jgi:hypothetical protein